MSQIVYRHFSKRGEKSEVVPKDLFSMWALFLGGWYALYFGVFWWYVGLYTPFFVLLFLGTYFEFFLFLAVLYDFFAIWIYFPTYAHEWRAAKLRSKGFNYDGDIEASSTEEALEKFKLLKKDNSDKTSGDKKDWFWGNENMQYDGRDNHG